MKPHTQVSRKRETSAELEDLFVAYREFYGRSGDVAEARAFIRQRLLLGDSHVWVAMDGQRIVAFAQVYVEHSSLGLRTDWILNDLFVSPDARGTGSGRALVERIMAEASDADVRTVRLETQSTNVLARGLYESCGFTTVGLASGDEFMVYEWDAGKHRT